MILEMKVPFQGNQLKEVEIATWLVKDGDYVEKDQAIAEVDSDKATLELPAEASGIITLKAEEGDAVAVGAVVCLIDTGAAKPEVVQQTVSKKKNPKKLKLKKLRLKSSSSSRKNRIMQARHPSSCNRKILEEKNIEPSEIVGTGKGGRITKDDAVNAVPSMGTPNRRVREQKEQNFYVT